MLTLKEHDHMQIIFYTYIHSKDGMTDVYIKKNIIYNPLSSSSKRSDILYVVIIPEYINRFVVSSRMSFTATHTTLHVPHRAAVCCWSEATVSIVLSIHSVLKEWQLMLSSSQALLMCLSFTLYLFKYVTHHSVVSDSLVSFAETHFQHV